MTDKFVLPDQGTNVPPNNQADTQLGGGEDVSLLHKRLNDKDAFIETLKSEKRALEEAAAAAVRRETELAEQLRNAASVEELAKKLLTSNPSKQENVNVDELVAQAATLATQNITDAQRKAQEDANYKQAMGKVVEVFGKDNAIAKLQERAAQLGMDEARAVQLARTAPQAFNELFFPKAQLPQGTTPPSTVRIGNVDTSTTDKKALKAQFDDMRRKDPGRYWTPQVQKQIFQLGIYNK